MSWAESIDARVRAGEAASLPPSAARALMVLRAAADPQTGVYAVTQADLGRAIGASPRTASLALAHLEIGGWIERVQRGRITIRMADSGSVFTAGQLLSGERLQSSDIDMLSDCNLSKTFVGLAQKNNTPGAQPGVNQNPKDKDINPERQNPPLPPLREGLVKKPKTAVDPDGFAEFWTLYPRRVARPAAVRAWLAHAAAGTIEPASVMAGLHRWLASSDWAGRESKYIPHPATWLNQRRWEDEPEPATKGTRAGEYEQEIRVRWEGDE